MMRSSYSSTPGFFQGGLTRGVKIILIGNLSLFVLQIVLGRFLSIPLELYLGLSRLALEKGLIFQVFTYMWLHSTDQFMHIIFNMFGVWMFGRELEHSWGTNQFLKYYIASGVGAGIVILVLDLLFGSQFTLTIGASGALFGILLASAMSWPDREVYLYFLFPIKMKYFVTGFGVISFLGLLGDGSGNVSHSGHLGGLLAGYLYIMYKRKGWSKFFDLKKGDVKISNSKGSQKGYRSKKWDNVIHIGKPGRGYARDAANGSGFNSKDDLWKKKKVDELLDRISQNGLDSLSDEEKQFLNKISKDYKSKD